MNYMATQKKEHKLYFYDFFAGGGMANLGLGSQWQCLMANDYSEKKANAYRINFPPADEFILKDVSDLVNDDMPGHADMAWASFPCQDLSLAGGGHGLLGERSGSYWGFWKLMRSLRDDKRTVPIIVLENVVGTITANKGMDFRILLESLVEIGYRVGALVVNAMHFIPQSRPRLFIIAVRQEQKVMPELLRDGPDEIWHTKTLRKAHKQLPTVLQKEWLWWNLPKPMAHSIELIDLIEENPTSVKWHTVEETQRLLELMSELHRKKVREMQALGKKTVGTLYRRTRRGKDNKKVQRAEVRFDQVSGCLRTGTGGSSRQFIIVVEGEHIRSRLLSTREAARLMGLPDTYKIPERYNDAYHLIGDGLAIPVVSWLEQYILTPLALSNCNIAQPESHSAQIKYLVQPVQRSLNLVEFT